MSPTENFRRDLEDILYLTNPLVIVNNTIEPESILVSTIESANPENLLTLNLKPSLKVDKKLKKSDKNDERETDRNILKLKIKKKKSKVSFEDDYEVTSELLEVDPTDSVAPLPLARPSKPLTKEPIAVNIKKKSVSISTAKKKSTHVLGIKKANPITEAEKPKEVTLTKPITVQELGDLFKVSTTEIIKSLFLKGIPVTVNQLIDIPTAEKVGIDFGIEVVSTADILISSPKRSEFLLKDTSVLEKRPPIVTIMGHVDHGKTTLLDKIRNTQIAKKEAGGITQKIGAYEVNVNYKGVSETIVFLDTPGHAAFSGMRSRGVSITDLVILVVAADDGIKPQTIEAIKYAQSAQVPLVVAINKMDKEEADLNKIQQDLITHNIVPEEWGGDTIVVPISAMQGTNIDTLLEAVLMVAEITNLKTDPDVPARGMILESHLDRSKGSVATLIVKHGTLKVGDIITSGNSISKVRGMIDSNGKNLELAPPSSPVLIWGLSKLPNIGDTFRSFKTEKEAKIALEEELSVKSISSYSFSSFQQFSDINLLPSGEQMEKINLIIKTDTQGSAEAITSTISNIASPKIQLKVLYAYAGEITETDIEFASASQAILLAFNTTFASGTKKAAKNSSILIKEFNVIYDLFDYVEELIADLVGPEYEERFIGSAIVKTIFPLAKSFVAGSLVTEGKITKDSTIHVIRDSQIIHKGKINSLKKVKEDVLEVTENFECGIYVTNFDSWRPGDAIKAFEIIEKKNTHSKK
jgi:translation initiation factor IF-2